MRWRTLFFVILFCIVFRWCFESCWLLFLCTVVQFTSRFSCNTYCWVVCQFLTLSFLLLWFWIVLIFKGRSHSLCPFIWQCFDICFSLILLSYCSCSPIRLTCFHSGTYSNPSSLFLLVELFCVLFAPCSACLLSFFPCVFSVWFSLLLLQRIVIFCNALSKYCWFPIYFLPFQCVLLLRSSKHDTLFVNTSRVLFFSVLKNTLPNMVTTPRLLIKTILKLEIDV